MVVWLLGSKAGIRWSNLKVERAKERVPWMWPREGGSVSRSGFIKTTWNTQDRNDPRKKYRIKYLQNMAVLSEKAWSDIFLKTFRFLSVETGRISFYGSFPDFRFWMPILTCGFRLPQNRPKSWWRHPDRHLDAFPWGYLVLPVLPVLCYYLLN